MTSPALAFDDVRVHHGTVRALDGLTWSADHGRITCLLGPNGAGKSTAVDCATGLQRPDAGAVRVLGADPWGAPADHRARVAVMLQDGGLPTGVRPSALLEHLSRLYARPRNWRDLWERLGIDAFDSRIIRRLSGGQRQRVALAAALVGRPEVVFLDEPTAGLDPHARLDVWDLVRRVAQDGPGACVVVTTHSFEEAARLADDVVVMARGRALAAGTPDELVSRHGSASLEDLFFDLTREAR